MLLATVVETSGKIAQTSKRLAKIDLLAALLRELHPDEIEDRPCCFRGDRQGHTGLGHQRWRGARSRRPNGGVGDVTGARRRPRAQNDSGNNGTGIPTQTIGNGAPLIWVRDRD